MNKTTWLEKIAPHRYQQHCICKPNDKQFISELLSDGFVLKEGSVDEYIGTPLTVDDLQLEFGMALAEAFNSMSEDQLFCREFCLHFMSKSQSALAQRNLTRGIAKDSVILSCIQEMGIDNFLYVVADNYSVELTKQAEKKRKTLSETRFLEWLKENVIGRVDQLENYLIGFSIPKIRSLDVYYAYVEIAYPLAAEYDAWVENFERRICSGEYIQALIDHDDKIGAFSAVAWFCNGKVLQRLFDIINDPGSDQEVKRIIRAKLDGVCKECDEFSMVINRERSTFQVHEQKQSTPEIEAAEFDNPVEEPIQKPVVVTKKIKSNAGAKPKLWFNPTRSCSTEAEMKAIIDNGIWEMVNSHIKSFKSAPSSESSIMAVGAAMIVYAAYNMKVVSKTKGGVMKYTSSMERTLGAKRNTVQPYLALLEKCYKQMRDDIGNNAPCEADLAGYKRQWKFEKPDVGRDLIIENYLNICFLNNNIKYRLSEALYPEKKNDYKWITPPTDGENDPASRYKHRDSEKILSNYDFGIEQDND